MFLTELQINSYLTGLNHIRVKIITVSLMNKNIKTNLLINLKHSVDDFHKILASLIIWRHLTIKHQDNALAIG